MSNTKQHKGKEKTLTKMIDELMKGLDKPPKLRVIPLQQTKDEKLKAKVLSKILQHEWGTIEERIKSEIYQPMLKCFLYGKHRFRGYGEKRMHKCRVCGWKTSTINNPIYAGFCEVSWDKHISSIQNPYDQTT